MTNIIVHGDNRIQNYDSRLSIPRNLNVDPDAGETLQFRYVLSPQPELAYEVVA